MNPGDILVDTDCRGFVARCLPSGVVTYGLRYRDRKTHKRHWIRLGLHGEITPDQARTQSMARLGEVARENNPLELRRIIVEKSKGTDTVAHMLDSFVMHYVKGTAKLRSGGDIEGIFDRVVKPAIGSRSIYDLKRSDITAMLDKVDNQRGPVMADRVLAHIRKAFNWQMTRNDAFISPVVRGMARTKPQDRERDRKLSPLEISQLWAATDSVNKTFGTLVKVLLLTGQRRDEIARMKWAWIDGDSMEIPADVYKTKRAHVVPLTRPVLDLIMAQPKREGCEYVFTTNGKTPYSGFSKSKSELDRAINANRIKLKQGEISNWRLHDLRRTGRSLMSSVGVSSDVAERVLGHVIQGIKRTYDRHDYLDEKRDALEKLSVAIERILTPPANNVVEISKAKKVKPT